MANSKLFIKQAKAAQKAVKQAQKQVSINKKLSKKYKSYSFPTPTGAHANWSFTAWCNWIEKHGNYTKK